MRWKLADKASLKGIIALIQLVYMFVSAYTMLIDPIRSRCKCSCQKNFNQTKINWNEIEWTPRYLQANSWICNFNCKIYMRFVSGLEADGFAFCALAVQLFSCTQTKSWRLEFIAHRAEKTCHNKRKWPAFAHFLHTHILLCAHAICNALNSLFHS